MAITHERVRDRLLAVLDALTYAGLVTVVAIQVALVLGVATGGGLAGANVFLFVIGWAIMAYSTVRLWPTSVEDVEESPERPSLAKTNRTRFQRVARALPPNRWLPLPPPEVRIPLPAQLFLGSLLVLLTSYLLEATFGVG